MKRSLILAMALSVLGLVVLQGGGSAFANHVSCGQTITQDTTLDSDLIDCSGDGLIIGADNVTLDLNGHTIDGAPGSGVGVASFDNDDVTIKDGVVRQFYFGVELQDATNSSLDHNLVTRMTISEVIDGMSVNSHGQDNAVIANRIFQATNSGIVISGGVGNTLIEDNRISDNGAGIYLSDARNQTIRGNTVFRNGEGIGLNDASRLRIERNRVFDNAGGGISGFVNHTVFQGNFANRNIVGIGLISEEGNQVIGNTTNGNSTDGIFIPDSPAIVSDNHANHNGDLGIEANPNVIDGGGNKASGNGNPMQCLYVACK